jgi:hypothetical protein
MSTAERRTSACRAAPPCQASGRLTRPPARPSRPCSGAAFTGNASGVVRFEVTSPPRLGSDEEQKSTVELPIKVLLGGLGLLGHAGDDGDDGPVDSCVHACAHLARRRRPAAAGCGHPAASPRPARAVGPVPQPQVPARLPAAGQPGRQERHPGLARCGGGGGGGGGGAGGGGAAGGRPATCPPLTTPHHTTTTPPHLSPPPRPTSPPPPRRRPPAHQLPRAVRRAARARPVRGGARLARHLLRRRPLRRLPGG